MMIDSLRTCEANLMRALKRAVCFEYFFFNLYMYYTKHDKS